MEIININSMTTKQAILLAEIYVMTLTLLTLLQRPENRRGRRARNESHRCWFGTNISAGSIALSSSETESSLL